MLTLAYILLGALIWSVLIRVAEGYRAERRRQRISRAIDKIAPATSCRPRQPPFNIGDVERSCELVAEMMAEQPQSGAADAPALADAAPGCAMIDVGEPPIGQWVFSRDGALAFTGDVDIEEC